ncbi:hypothetical protein PBT90_16735 [Algoriphagus halophytocola]|nr:hypothetical protein [Algoriphagus sp. TR-M9]WBL42384.1 hypothetical protein PBT90_16735 [Algoriphagus sp. TR-M9]
MKIFSGRKHVVESEFNEWVMNEKSTPNIIFTNQSQDSELIVFTVIYE